MTTNTEDRPRKGITKDREAEFESVGAAVLVEHVLDDMKTRVETLRQRLRNSLRMAHDRR